MTLKNWFVGGVLCTLFILSMSSCSKDQIELRTGTWLAEKTNHPSAVEEFIFQVSFTSNDGLIEEYRFQDGTSTFYVLDLVERVDDRTSIYEVQYIIDGPEYNYVMSDSQPYKKIHMAVRKNKMYMTYYFPFPTLEESRETEIKLYEDFVYTMQKQ